MIYFDTFEEKVTKRQHDAWEKLVAELQDLDDLGTEDGWLFHGTDQITSTYILKYGFNSQYVKEEADRAPVFWGTANIAAGFAQRKCYADSPPVILAARTKDVLASGIPTVDKTALDTGCSYRGNPFKDPRYLKDLPVDSVIDWKDSYFATGCLMVRNGRYPSGLVRHGISHLPLHPDCHHARRSRLSCRFLFDPHPEFEDLVLVADENPELLPHPEPEVAALWAEWRIPKSSDDIDDVGQLKL